MLLLPLLFVIFIINFPAGSILYWITTNTWTMGQQWVIRRRIGPGVPAANTVQALDSRRAPRQLDCPIGVLRSQTRDGMGVAGSACKRSRAELDRSALGGCFESSAMRSNQRPLAATPATSASARSAMVAP